MTFLDNVRAFFQPRHAEPCQPAPHIHNPYGDLQPAINWTCFTVFEDFSCMIALFPAIAELHPEWCRCDGGTIARKTPSGAMLVYAGCPYGIGDGVTTVNVPSMPAPLPGFEYRMLVGHYGS